MRKNIVKYFQSQMGWKSVFQKESASAVSSLAESGDLWVWLCGDEAWLCPSAYSGCGSNWVQIKKMQFYIQTQTEAYTGY